MSDVADVLAMSDVADVLRKACALYAANPSHVSCGDYPSPGTYCLSTAVQTAAAGKDVGFWRPLDVMQNVIGTSRIATWNAENSTETVLAAFDKAITEADNA